jgi:hypothetical protein
VQFKLNQPHPDVVRVWRWEYGFAGLSILFFMLTLLLRGLFAISPSVREQSRVVFAGAVLSFTPFVLALGFNLVNIPVGWVLAAFLFFPDGAAAQAGGRIQGKILARDGQALAGAVVTIFKEDRNGGIIQYTRTDGRGARPTIVTRFTPRLSKTSPAPPIDEM